MTPAQEIVHEKSDLDTAQLKSLGVSDELVGSLSPAEARDLLASLLRLKDKYHVAIRSA